MCDYLGAPQDNVLIHWACEKVPRSRLWMRTPAVSCGGVEGSCARVSPRDQCHCNVSCGAACVGFSFLQRTLDGVVTCSALRLRGLPCTDAPPSRGLVSLCRLHCLPRCLMKNFAGPSPPSSHPPSPCPTLTSRCTQIRHGLGFMHMPQQQGLLVFQRSLAAVLLGRMWFGLSLCTVFDSMCRWWTVGMTTNRWAVFRAVRSPWACEPAG